MSYYKVNGLSFNKDFTSYRISAASSNVRPLYYFNTVVNKKDNETSLDFVKDVVRAIIDGEYQLNNKKHSLNLYVELHLQLENIDNNRSLWFSAYDFDKEYHYDKGFSKPEYKENYENAISFKNNFIEKAARSFMNKSLKQFINELKKQEYVLTNFDTFVSRYSNNRFYRTSNINNAKIINGIDKMFIPYFIGKQYGMLLVDIKDKTSIKNKLKEILTERYNNWTYLHKDITLNDFIEKQFDRTLERLGFNYE